MTDGDDPARGDTLEVAPSTGAETVRTQDTTVRHPAPRAESVVLESSRLGRFHILDTLGSGGMGVVLAAYDPQLDRKVAIKVVRTRGLTPERREREAQRLLAEARAMAQLSHPNVVAVYEAGTLDDRVFIAMEYISGATLRAWLADRERPVPEILDAYVKAGRGLAAGHHAGLVHRDFKPDNVLVGYDGRVWVIDFGLARPHRASVDKGAIDDDETVPPVAAPSQLSIAGTLFGTPLYMAPEQHEKRELDARADQFAFCVSLYEALYRRMPFPCRSYGELASAVLEGNVIPPDEDPAIPRRVSDAVLRGLSPDPEARWPSMDTLLDQLVPQTRRRRGLIVGAVATTGVVAVAATLLGVKLFSGEPQIAASSPCAGVEDRLAGVWDAAVRREVEQAFAATGRSHAADSATRVAATLDHYAADWVARRREVCEATKIRFEVSEPTFDLRMQCLTERLGELRALTTLFRAADAATADRAIVAATGLAAPAGCVTITTAATARPTADQARALAELHDEFDAIHALAEVSRYGEVVERARGLTDRAHRVGFLPFEAKARHQLGAIESGANMPVESERTLRDALHVAARAKDDAQLAHTWASLIFALTLQGRHDDAIALVPIGELAVERAGGESLMQSELHYVAGSAYFAKGDYRRSIDAYERAYKHRVEARGEDHLDQVVILNSLGGAMLRVGHVNAVPTFERALALAEAKLGPHHPGLALTLANLGGVSQALFDFDKATTYHLRALPIFEEVYGPDHSLTGEVVYSLGVDANGREDYAAALPYYERALAIFEAISPRHPSVALSLLGLADCREEAGGDFVRAVAEGERGLALLLETKTEDGAQIAYAKYALAKALWSANRDRPRALALAREARAGFVKAGLAAMNGVLAVDKWFEKIKRAR
jgi:eukaryotic-like serine/threonine-protein kinase